MPESLDFFDASFLGELEDLAAIPQTQAAVLQGALPALLAEPGTRRVVSSAGKGSGT